MFPSDKQATLLVVDGSELIRSSTSRSLTTLGYHCLTADSGESCLELLGCNKIDLLFLDCALSGKESLELLSFLRQHYPDTPVIMTSSVMSSAEEEDAFSRGAYDYLVTPVNSCRLEITLKKRSLSRKTATRPSSFLR